MAGLPLSDGDGDSDQAADGSTTGDAPTADCDATGPFVGIVDVDRPSGGEAVDGFAPVGFDVPTDATLVFFLADVVDGGPGPAAVQTRAPLQWRSSEDFHGWTPDEMNGRAAVCALVVEDGQALVGCGSCRALP